MGLLAISFHFLKSDHRTWFAWSSCFAILLGTGADTPGCLWATRVKWRLAYENDLGLAGYVNGEMQSSWKLSCLQLSVSGTGRSREAPGSSSCWNLKPLFYRYLIMAIQRCIGTVESWLGDGVSHFYSSYHSQIHVFPSILVHQRRPYVLRIFSSSKGSHI